VFLPNTHAKYAKQIAENLRTYLFALQVDKSIRITVSIGVAGTSPDKEDIEALIKESDKVMYLAKANGRNKVVLWNEGGIDS